MARWRRPLPGPGCRRSENAGGARESGRPIGERAALRASAVCRGHRGRARGATAPRREDAPETPPSSFTKRAGCSAAPRSPHKADRRLASPRTRGTPAPRAPEKTEKPLAAEAPSPNRRALLPRRRSLPRPQPERSQPVPAPATPPAPPAVTAPASAGASQSARPKLRLRRRVRKQGSRELLARYKSALEARDLDALKRVWPGLSGQRTERDPRRVQAREPDCGSRSVDPRTSVSGATGTVSFLRRYEMVTVEGQRLRTETRTTMEVRRSGIHVDHRTDPFRTRTLTRTGTLLVAIGHVG